MSFANNEETKLFVQLSEDQEEIVAGGNGDDLGLGHHIGNIGISKTDFLYKSVDLATVSASGKDGSIASGALSKKVLDTSGLNVIVFKH
ncbi:CTB family bacteriocin [Mastigocoleus testarum]|uniref:Bacteriocin n=1 Tax=Mastigocoleus testarum BC008 TaxID=371196 RepID=A0A0V7ZQL3_9CYAN|nr:CTB family bacteriocin [Mastigocoleus testarum]KST66873.1 hypothetical protein BC008_27180 [Mastigocoleus testarum BC008]KST70211.1 hypothetical protein BC008_36785 [Mastigocoleus testarum BC008]